MDLNFRTLTPEEIECKATIVGNAIEISLHTKAAVCTKMLNEEVGPMNWEKEYTNGNKNCIVRIWDADKNRMISKEDCGGPLTEIDGHKGQASNGFKRVCALGWGLGIELYSQPEILLPRTDDNTVYDDEKKGLVVSERYTVKIIEYDKNKQITHCVIVNSDDVVVYDGPNEKGQSNVDYPAAKEEQLIIPEDADLINSEANEENDELPDNTDGFEDEHEEFMTQKAPFGSVDYRKELDSEIKRTNVKRADVMRAMGINSLEEVDTVSTDVLDETLRKLKAMKTYRQ